jgi:hypothetical protein
MTRDELERRLKAHDWYYAFSDDGRVYDKGVKDWREIKVELDKLPAAEAARLVATYAPARFAGAHP